MARLPPPSAFPVRQRNILDAFLLTGLPGSSLKGAIKRAVIELLKPRLSSTDRLIVGAVLAFLSLPRSVNCGAVIRAFLEPVEDESQVWKPILELESHLVASGRLDDKREWDNRLSRVMFIKIASRKFAEKREMSQESEDVMEDNMRSLGASEERRDSPLSAAEVLNLKVSLWESLVLVFFLSCV